MQVFRDPTVRNGPTARLADSSVSDTQTRGGRKPSRATANRRTARATYVNEATFSANPPGRPDRTWRQGAPKSGWLGFGIRNASASTPGMLLRQKTGEYTYCPVRTFLATFQRIGRVRSPKLTPAVAVTIASRWMSTGVLSVAVGLTRIARAASPTTD